MGARLLKHLTDDLILLNVLTGSLSGRKIEQCKDHIQTPSQDQCSSTQVRRHLRVTLKVQCVRCRASSSNTGVLGSIDYLTSWTFKGNSGHVGTRNKKHLSKMSAQCKAGAALLLCLLVWFQYQRGMCGQRLSFCSKTASLCASLSVSGHKQSHYCTVTATTSVPANISVHTL